ncbi:NAD(P)H-binding protein [Vibrio sp. LaRot3]|uniref:NAD(P)H-binding protein n=1 Tax=Vibrio sp. LaRot3 TaxID=2998829 RepID=UPI0022CDF924|nr:NAD(P)H-binding protein [Vibrio sp. LaRot3]MDA0147653.1 NAD(P)H-binding protein [Vibrio sp. LaRot3]
MDKNIVMIAGATGLIGNELTKMLLEETAIDHIYALSRKPLPFFHPKLELIQHQELKITQWQDDSPAPTKGYICLGTTKKQAGSNQSLEQVDVHLVREVAQTMKLVGVKHLTVVSSYGANSRSLSHYLRCKGKMELALSDMGFEQVIFVRPGPLKGLRDVPRKDEALVQTSFKLLRPLMLGPLANLIPIEASSVAKAMLYASFGYSNKRVQCLDRVEMLALLKKYQ